MLDLLPELAIMLLLYIAVQATVELLMNHNI